MDFSIQIINSNPDFASTESPSSDQKLNISIYYEGLCGDSRRFIEAFDTYYNNGFADYLNVRFIPFGKASITIQNDGSYDYICQHGKNECIQNTIHNCALVNLPPGEQQVEFVACAMRYLSIRDQQKCVEKRGLDWNENNKCVNGEAGQYLTIAAQYDTVGITKGPLKFVPTIVINNKFSQENQDIALRNPADIICKYRPEIEPCTKNN